MSKRAIIYARVSTDEQAEQGYGISYQVTACEAYAERRGYALVADPVTDDYTGKTAFRPGMNALLDLLESLRIDVVIVHRTDRLGRRASVQETLEAEIEARGAIVEYVAATFDRTTAVGRAMRRIQGTFDQLDYEATVEKLREHKTEAVKHGSVVTSFAPYGYQVVKDKDATGKRNNRLEIVEDEAAIIRLIYDWYVHGDETGTRLPIRAIARRLSEQRIPTRWDTLGLARAKSNVGTWAERVIHRILTDEVYIGHWHFQRTKRIPQPGSDTTKQVKRPRTDWLSVPVPAIISHDLWHAAQDLLQRNKLWATRNRKHHYLFSNMVSCKHCGGACCGKINNNYKRYICWRVERHQCSLPMVTEQALDAVIWPWIREIVKNPAQVTEALAHRQSLADEQNVRLQSMIATIDRLITEARTEQQRVLTLYKKGKLDEERWEAEDAEYERTIANHETERAALGARLTQPRYTSAYLASLEAACERIRIGIDAFNREEKRQTYELLNLQIQIAVEDGIRVAYATCELDERKLTVGPPRGTIVSTLCP